MSCYYIYQILFIASNLTSMETEKSFKSTTNLDCLIEGYFLINNALTRLVILPDSITYSNQRVQCTYIINFDFSYDIAKDNNGWVLTINCPQPIKFFSLLDLDAWESALGQIIKRRRFHEFYKGVKRIGKGNFASVYLTQRLIDNKQFAVKAFQKQSTFKLPNGKKGLQNQINILRKLNHPNISHLQAVFETENSIYLVMDLVEGQSLGEILDQQKMIAHSARTKIIKGVLSALAELEATGIVHRDIKPENIMVDSNGQAKIVDFGLATHSDACNYLYVRCGTPGFVAPEIISIHDGEQVKMSTISDVFSAGAIFYQMIFGKALFDGEQTSEVLEKNRKCIFTIPHVSEITSLGGQIVDSTELVLLRRMLDVSPHTRITPQQALKSNYFTQMREPLKEIGISQRQQFTQNIIIPKYNNSTRIRKAKKMENCEN